MGAPVIVVGSLNMDLVVRCARAPEAGETVPGRSLTLVPGGKGANQAAAAARLGAAVRMAGTVGADDFGDRLLAGLVESGVDTAAILRGTCETGTAVILVDDRGENRIAVVPGANAELTPERAESAVEGGAGLLLLQLEVPMESVCAAARRARRLRVPVMLNAAPALALPAELVRCVDHLLVNEVEAVALLGRPVPGAGADWGGVLEELRRESGFAEITLTLGAQGAIHLGDSLVAVRAPEVEVIDTTAAGDAFAGAWAAAQVAGLTSAEALCQAVAAGSFAVTVAGAQPSLPRPGDVTTMLQRAIRVESAQ